MTANEAQELMEQGKITNWAYGPNGEIQIKGPMANPVPVDWGVRYGEATTSD